jgi:hypothetical protein
LAVIQDGKFFVHLPDQLSFSITLGQQLVSFDGHLVEFLLHAVRKLGHQLEHHAALIGHQCDFSASSLLNKETRVVEANCLQETLGYI